MLNTNKFVLVTKKHLSFFRYTFIFRTLKKTLNRHMATVNNNGENYTFAFPDDNYEEFIPFVIQLSRKIIINYA